MPELSVQNGTVILRSVKFPVQIVKDAMAETGGMVVADNDLNMVLDSALCSWQESKETQDLPACLSVEAIPMTLFVPKKIRVHFGKPGTPVFDSVGKQTNVCLWFAVNRVF